MKFMRNHPPTSNVPHPGGQDQYLTGIRLWSLTLTLCLSSAISTLYVTIIATAIPSITTDFKTISDLDWYSTAYLLTLCSMQPLGGRIYRNFPLKKTWIVYITIFEIGNLTCALARNSPTFIVGRAVAGLGAAGLSGGGQVMFSAAAHPRIRPTLMALGMAVTSLGGVVGPVLGGSITQHAGWRWCFWIFLPLGGLCVFIFLFIRVPEQIEKPPIRELLCDLPKRLDLVGFALFVPPCVMILLALSWGGQKYPWKNATIIGLLCGSAANAAVFIAWQWYRQDSALLPPKIFKYQVVFYGCLVAFLQGGSFLEMGYYLPLWFQSVKQATPTNSGLMLLPTMVSQIIATILSGVLVSKLLYIPPWAVLGAILTAVGAGLMTSFSINSTEGHWIGYQVLAGMGRGFALQMPVQAIQRTLNGAEISIGTAMIQFSQYFGGTVFLTIAKSVFEGGLPSALRQFAPGVDPTQIINSGSTHITNGLSPGEVEGVLKAYNKALVITFWLPAAAGILSSVCGLGLGWQKVTPRKKPAESRESRGKQQELTGLTRNRTSGQ